MEREHLQLVATTERLRRERQPNYGVGRRYNELVAQGKPKMEAARIALAEQRQAS